MAFQISPGVNITEKDVTLIVPAIATTPAGMVGLFQWGPGNEPITITSEKELAQIFGKPLKSTGGVTDATKYNRWWWTAANFLSYGNNIKVIRFINSGGAARTAASGITAITGSQLSGATSKAAYTATVNDGFWAAKYPGTLGNGLKVVVLDNYAAETFGANTNGDTDQYIDYIRNFDGLPGTSPWATNLTGAALKDEIHVLVIDAAGNFSGTAGTVLEKFSYLSKASNAVNQNGTSNYYRDVINNESQYVWALNHLDAAGITINSSNTPTLTVATASGSTIWGTTVVPSTSSAFKVMKEANGENIIVSNLYGGALDTTPSDDDIAEAYETYMGDPEIIDVALFITGPLGKTAAYRVIEIAEARKDVVAFVSPIPAGGFNQTPSAYVADILTF
jgi:hypothetical protein